ncbi:histidine kinase/DNA gyrase B/HSP90-like ATPase [Paenibacillus taihuensis]|uniref:Histidine kinase/DNA gyrase B/HSP90-like ATPase n=1 Tax=Paenibacillus taihuensis TaxID=1156355 RepID=A0A3D9SF76_9BACL|nr:sensor histidine kinase [Paenibacillus taihuensis]REE94578.1 histidine kinase/DNA gyrase B/HSP90-like ATPase [Paenibacillus taihuensis]
MIRLSRSTFKPAGFSLRAQLIFSFVAVTLLVLSISSYYSYVKTLDIFKERTQETTFSQFRQIEMNTLTLLHEVDKLSNTFLMESKVQSFLQSDKLSNLEFISLERDIMERINQYLTNYDYLDSIYIFTENGTVIGGTLTQNQSAFQIGRGYAFYNTELYSKVKTSFPQSIWTGGLKTSDFMRSSIPEGLTNSRLISSIRGVRWIGGSQMSAELVLNVNERFFNAGYGSLQSLPGGSIHIIDGSGKVISSTNQETINAPYLFNTRIKPGVNFGSFSTDRDGSHEQVIYYRMSETGWMLVNEVPTELYTKDVVGIGRFIAAIFLLSLVLIVLISTLWMNRIMKSFHQLVKGMRFIGKGNIGHTLPKASNLEMGQLIEQFNHMSTGILELMQQNEETERTKRQLEIEALQSQINPHFLYNTLNTVKWMAAIAKAPNIMECMTSLGNMLRPIYYDPSPLWSIKEELEFVRNYINIMNFRYGEELKFEFDVPEQLLHCRTLRFMIQPSIENALIHGEMHQGVIQVSVAELNGDLQVVVRDTCGGMSPSKVLEVNERIKANDKAERPAKGIGLSNVNKRIQLHFGERYGIEVRSSEGVETRVYMMIPIITGSEAS